MESMWKKFGAFVRRVPIFLLSHLTTVFPSECALHSRMESGLLLHLYYDKGNAAWKILLQTIRFKLKG
jgi:hypothetical protein